MIYWDVCKEEFVLIYKRLEDMAQHHQLSPSVSLAAKSS